jgi:hypothetical protein
VCVVIPHNNKTKNKYFNIINLMESNISDICNFEINFEEKEVTYYIKHFKESFLKDKIVENLKHIKIVGKRNIHI